MTLVVWECEHEIVRRLHDGPAIAYLDAQSVRLRVLMDSTPYYLSKDGQAFGPYSPEDLRTLLANGVISGSDFTWREGLADWFAARLCSRVRGS